MRSQPHKSTAKIHKFFSPHPPSNRSDATDAAAATDLCGKRKGIPIGIAGPDSIPEKKKTKKEKMQKDLLSFYGKNPSPSSAERH